MAELPRSGSYHIPSGPRAQVRGDENRYLFGKAVYPPGGHCGPRVQEVFQLVVLLRGQVRITVRETSHLLAPGDAILQQPGLRELFEFSPTAESTHTWCELSPAILTPADRRLLRAAHGPRQAPSAVHVLIEEGLAVQRNAGPELHEAMAALARACLLRFAAHAPTGTPPSQALQRARDLVAAEFVTLHSAEDLAHRAGLSPSHLRALFRQAGGESPSALIWRLKVEHAIQLIRSTGLTLGEIAENCGYANPFHLSRAVRRHTGHSPRQLRRAEWGS